MHRFTLASLFCLSLFGSAWAQPFKYGCHYFRDRGPAKQPLTLQEKALIDDIIARSDTFNILDYDITIDVTDYTGETVTAATTITYAALMPGQDFIRFDLRQLIVDSVTDGSGALTFDHTGEFLKVYFATPPSVGISQTLNVYYHGSPYRDPSWGGFYFESNYIYNLGIGLTTIPPNFGRVWYPCFDSFVERATYRYTVTSAGGRTPHCQGDLVNEILLGGDTVQRTFVLGDPITTHVAAIAVSDYQDSTWIHTGAYGPVPVTLTARTANLPGMVAKFTGIDGAIDALEFWFGPQPYSRVGYVHTTDGAMEHPTNIAYPYFMNGQTLLDNQGLYSHELGHHWWGNMVTPRVHNHMWLKEGPAEYSSHLAEEWIHGHDAFVDMVKDNHLYVLEQAHLQDDGFQALSPMPDEHIYGVHTYYKGASVLHNLHGYLGDTLFRQAMSGAQIALANTDITPEEFRDALEAASGADLHPFFDAQVFAPGFGVFVVQSMSVTGGGSSWSVDLSIRQRLREAPAWHEQVPLDLTLIGASGERQEYLIGAGGEFTPVNVVCSFEPVMAVLNGHARLNQARMDHEFTIQPGVSFPSTLPYVDFRVFGLSVPDTALVRVEHIWAGPDADNLGWGIDEISDVHYWIVDGLWPTGLQLQGRAYYDGQVVTDLDWDLYGPTEADAMLVYRATPSDPWEVYPNTTLFTGSLTDGLGNMRMDTLLRGQYAFAKGTAIAAVPELSQDQDALSLFPVPAQDLLTVSGTAAPHTVALFDVLSTDGRLQQRTTARLSGAFEKQLETGSLSSGAYVLRVSSVVGTLIGTRTFEVRR